MVDTPSLLISSIVWDSITFGGEIRVRATRRSRRVTRRTGAATWIEGQEAVDKEYEIEVEYDDENTRQSLHEGSPERVGKESSLVVKILNSGSGAAGFQFTYANAMQMENNEDDNVNEYGRYTARFFARSSDGVTNPLTIVTF